MTERKIPNQVYDKLASFREVPTLDSNYGQTANLCGWTDPAIEGKRNSPTIMDVNRVLLQIFNDDKLHASVRAYGEQLNFAQIRNNHPEFKGYYRLVLDPRQRMLLLRNEPAHPLKNEKFELNSYPLKRSEQGIFYDHPKNGVCLAALDIRTEYWNQHSDKSNLLTGDKIWESLEKALTVELLAFEE